MSNNVVTTLGNATKSPGIHPFSMTAVTSYSRPRIYSPGGSKVHVSHSTVIFPNGEVETLKSLSTDLKQQADITNSVNGHMPNTKLDGWLALYAVKTPNNDAVTVIDTTMPTQQNYSMLNSKFGANAWVYLGTMPTDRLAKDVNHNCSQCHGRSKVKDHVREFPCGYWYQLDNLEYLESKYEERQAQIRA